MAILVTGRVKTPLSAREVRGWILGMVRSDEVSAMARHPCGLVRSCVAQALEMDPSSRYTLRRKTASIMMI